MIMIPGEIITKEGNLILNEGRETKTCLLYTSDAADE